MVALKLIIAISFIGVALLFLAIRYYGKVSVDNQKKYLSYHRFFATAATTLVLFAVIATEILVRLNGGLQNKELFYVHIIFAMPFLASLLFLRFYLTGLKDPKLHRIVAYACIVLYIFTFWTGIVLLIKI